MSNIELYKEMILKNSQSPLNKNKILNCTHTSKGNNPLCGDSVELFANIKDKKIYEISFLGDGCAISIASASVLTQILKGKTIKQSYELIQKFNQMIESNIPFQEIKYLNNKHFELIKSFESISNFPMRRKCATLSWLTLDSALNKKKNIKLT